MTDKEQVDLVRKGGRVVSEMTLFNNGVDNRFPFCTRHDWRTVVCCDYEHDICECRLCGEQSVFKCDFDEEYS